MKIPQKTIERILTEYFETVEWHVARDTGRASIEWSNAMGDFHETSLSVPSFAAFVVFELERVK